MKRRGKGKKTPYSNTKLYYIYHNIKTRCYNSNSTNYIYYGARGISMCDEWLESFLTFREWAFNNGYKEGQGLSIDRIDVNGNYEPNNCRWVDNKTQQNNKSDNHYITYNNKTQTLGQWAEELCIHRQTLSNRIYRNGWSIDKAFTTPVKETKKYITYDNKTLNISEWAKELNVKRDVISGRLLRGWDFPDIVDYIRNRFK